MTKKLTSWSFSRYSTYVQCPLKAKLKFIDKLKEPPNKAMARGSEIHTLAEQYIKGAGRVLPTELKLFKVELTGLRKQYKRPDHGMVVEESWAFDKDWNETQWDNWAECVVRIKLDCAHHVGDDVLVVTDWKTGRYRPDNAAEYLEQLELYALAALVLHPYLIEVRPRLVYLDEGKIYPEVPLVYVPADVPRLKKLWAQRMKAMLNDERFAPKPNRFCNWCHFRKSNGGPCQY